MRHRLAAIKVICPRCENSVKVDVIDSPVKGTLALVCADCDYVLEMWKKVEAAEE